MKSKISSIIRTLLLLTIYCSINSVFAQAPQKMSYQAVIRNTSNVLITSTTVGMRISVLQGTISGPSVYTETQTPTTNVNGLASIEIGTGVVVSGSFSTINWALGSYFIKTEVDPLGGSTYTITGTTQLTSVPYALFSATSGSGETPGTAVGDMKYWNGTAWVIIPIGAPGQSLKVTPSNIPQWSTASALSTVTSDSVTSVVAQSANFAGTVTSSGGELVLSRGFCYNTSINPTVSNSVVITGSGVGSFSGSFSGLSANTTYYARAFSTSIAGTSYGSQLTFTTLTGIATLTTTAATSVSACSAVSGGSISTDGGAPIYARGVCWNTSPNPTISNFLTYSFSTNVYTSNLTSLSGSTTYYYRAFASNGVGTHYGNELSFTTTSGAATLTTSAAASITSCSAAVSINVTANGGEALTTSGICFATSVNPTTSNSIAAFNPNYPFYDSNINSFTKTLSGLLPSTTYYARAYATNCAGTTYGNQVSFVTTSVALPVVTTGSLGAVTGATAVINSNLIASNLCENPSAYGICWSTTTGPTTSSSLTVSVTPTASFSATMTGLSLSTTYYIRAYATNSAGTVYGAEINFTTINTPSGVVTTAITGVTGGAAYSGVTSVASNGGSSITATGVCWSTSPSPTLSNSFVVSGYYAPVPSTINKLTTSTTYYVRAYASNIAGTTYGNQLTFTTTAILSVGGAYQGGVIGYVLQPGDLGYSVSTPHGLIINPSSLGDYEWGCSGTLISGAMGIAIGTGNQNTLDIVAGCSNPNIAAQVCNNLVFGGYNDWYLPSANEKVAIDANWELAGIVSYYELDNSWSSSQFDAYDAYYYDSSSHYFKNFSGLHVYAIRSF
jgi:hypothetical protein